MDSELSNVLSDLLQSTQDSVEVGAAFSEDSGVSSCSDSEPSSPVISQHFTQLTNADVSAYTRTEWFHTTSTMYQDGDVEPNPGPLWSSADPQHSQWETLPPTQSTPLHLPTSVAEHHADMSSLTYVKGEWVETKAGFQVCHTGDGTAKVKLGGGLTYEIGMDIDLPDSDPSPVVKTEMASDRTPSSLYQFNTYTDDNNNINNNSAMFHSYADDNCNSCFHNRSSTYGVSHCGPFQYSDATNHNNACAESPDDRLPSRRRQSVTRTERLWEFILRLLGDPRYNPDYIEWADREDGTFRLNNSKAIAHMWGMRKNNVQMTYEKLSRALRYYYHRQILEPVLGKKLVYRFGPNATPVWENRVYRPQTFR